MQTFLNYITEQRLDRQQESDFFKLKSMRKSLSMLNNDIRKVTTRSVNNIIKKICGFCKIDNEKFRAENRKIIEKITNFIVPPAGADFFPIAIVYYESTGVYLMLVRVSSGNFISRVIGSMPVLGSIYDKITGNANGMYLFPIIPEIDTGKLKIDSSGAAVGQMSMTILLSDIDCEVIWPVSVGSGRVGKIVIKTLDFICPSLIDLLSLCTFGGASIAGRIAKLSKYAAKATKHTKKIGNAVIKTAKIAGSKTAKKTAAKRIAVKGFRKSWAKVPPNLRKTILKNKNNLKKLNKVSRQLKADIKSLIVLKQKLEDIKNEIMSMSADDLFAFSRNFIVIYIKHSLPREKYGKLKNIMSKIPDEAITSMSEYIKNNIKNFKNEEIDNEMTMFDVFKTILHTQLEKLITTVKS